MCVCVAIFTAHFVLFLASYWNEPWLTHLHDTILHTWFNVHDGLQCQKWKSEWENKWIMMMMKNKLQYMLIYPFFFLVPSVLVKIGANFMPVCWVIKGFFLWWTITIMVEKEGRIPTYERDGRYKANALQTLHIYCKCAPHIILPVVLFVHSIFS